MKTAIAALLLMFLSSQLVRADVKLYQYDGKLPFVQMMLNMMVAMGILDRLPSNGRYGMAGFPSSPWSGLSNPYSRALAMRGLSPASSFASPYGSNPFSNSPWLRTPWSSSAANGVGWGSPNWGVLPVESYVGSPYGYAPDSLQRANPYGSSKELDGWVNESWETSAWNPKAETHADVRSVQTSQLPQSVQPAQDFNYNTPVSAGETSRNRNSRLSPLAKLTPPSHAAQSRRQPPLQRQSPVNNRFNQTHGAEQKHVTEASTNKLRQKPCVTEFCGLKKPDLNGLWVAQDGEMLGIKNNRYLWSDSSSRYLTGKIKIQNEYLLANVDGYERLMRFKYKLAGNYLLTMQPDGKIREFTRMRADQYSNYAQGSRGDYRQSYY